MTPSAAQPNRDPVEVTRSALATITAAAAAAHPREACGLLLGRSGRIERAQVTANVAPDPARHFEIDPAALFAAHRAERAGEEDLIGYWHSHPVGPAHPSATDRAGASGDGRAWAIVGTAGGGEPAVTFWRDGDAGFEALSLRVVAS